MSAEVELGTKQNLTLAALELFAEQGIDAVSMRNINAAAGARNASAVHYHFGNKEGMIEAILDFIRTELNISRAPALIDLEQQQNPTTREILWAAFEPYLRLYAEPEYGSSAIRFMARLQFHMSTHVHDRFYQDPQRVHHRFDDLLAKALPHLGEDVRRTRYIIFWTLMVQGLANAEGMANTVFGDIRAGSAQEAQHRFFDYLVGGVEAI